jgi:hypothetical protein
MVGSPERRLEFELGLGFAGGTGIVQYSRQPPATSPKTTSITAPEIPGTSREGVLGGATTSVLGSPQLAHYWLKKFADPSVSAKSG